MVDTIIDKMKVERAKDNSIVSDKDKQVYTDKSTGIPLNQFSGDLETGINLKIRDILNSYSQLMIYTTKYETLKRALIAAQNYSNYYSKNGEAECSSYESSKYSSGYIELLKMSGSKQYLEQDIKSEQLAVVVVYRETCKRYFRDLNKLPNKFICKAYRRYEDNKIKNGQLTQKDLRKVAKQQAKEAFKRFKDIEIVESLGNAAGALSGGTQIYNLYKGFSDVTLKGINALSDLACQLKANAQNPYYRETWQHLGDRDRDKNLIENLKQAYAHKLVGSKALNYKGIFGQFDDYIEWKNSVFQGIEIDDNAVREMSFYVSRLNTIFYEQSDLQGKTPFNKSGIHLEETLELLIFDGETLAFQADKSQRCYNYFIKSEIVVLGWMLLRRLYSKYNGYKLYGKVVPDIQNEQILRAWEFCCYCLGLSCQDFRMIVDQNIKLIRKYNRKQLNNYQRGIRKS